MIMANEANDSYISGSDLLLKVAGKAVGHCTSHTTTLNSETKDRAVKPVATAARSAGFLPACTGQNGGLPSPATAIQR